jgi:hypothetical protein
MKAKAVSSNPILDDPISRYSCLLLLIRPTTIAVKQNHKHCVFYRLPIVLSELLLAYEKLVSISK